MSLWQVSALGPRAAIKAAGLALEALENEAPLSIATFETDGPNWSLDALYAEEPDLGPLSALAPSLKLETALLPEVNWVLRSLEGLVPIRAGRFFVHGAHDADKRPPGLIPVCIEAGEAFGTGHHGTTEACLDALCRIAREERPANVLDLGTGSGVLAIAAAKLWRAPVTAGDIDPIAVRVARENVRSNGVAPQVRTVLASGVNHAAIHENAPFDLIIANILARPLRRLARDIAHQLAPGGALVLSGILGEQAARVLAVYQGHRITSQQRLTYGDWVTLICRKA